MSRTLLLSIATLVMLSACQPEFSTFGANESENTNGSAGSNSGNNSSADSTTLSIGKTLYAAQCANCHGDTGTGQPAGSSIASSLVNPVQASFAIASSMPIQNPTQCDTDCADAIVAWLRVVNGFDAAPDEPSTGNGGNSGRPITDNERSALEQITLEPASQTFRRASLLLTGDIPNEATLDAMAFASDAQLRAALMSLMNGEGFKEFVKRGANDRLHVRGGNSSDIYNALNNYYTNLGDLIDQRDDDGLVDYNWSVREEPLELIAHVVMNNRPYGEILTANYTLVNDALTQLYNSGVTTNGTWKLGTNRNQSVRAKSNKLESSDREISIPHAGILSTIGFNARWQSTATNRNRARAKYVLLHFLGYDIEATASRDFSDEDLADTNNPTMNNPTCVQCHEVLDPIAGAFQNIGDVGIHFDRKGSNGADSLDPTYVSKSDFYTAGDRWYADMRTPGYYSATLPNRDQSLQWLAKQVVADARFAEGTIRFWWPAIFGEEFTHDKLTNAQLTARLTSLTGWANTFNNGQSLKGLIADMLMSPWFRATSKDNTLADGSIVYATGGKRLLTPEEVSNKASSLTGMEVDSYGDEFISYYGGIDSASSLIRAREMTPLMNKVLERVAFENSCNIVANEFNTPIDQRNLFTFVDRHHRAGTNYLAIENFTSAATRESANNDTHTVVFESNGLPIQLQLELNGKPMYLGQVVIRNSNNQTLLNSYGDAFATQYELDTDRSTSTNKLSSSEKAAYLRSSQTQLFEVALPPGKYSLTLTSWRKDPQLSYEVHVVHALNRNDNAFYAPQLNPVLAQQMQYLIQRLHGRFVPQNADEIESLIELFDKARLEKIERGSHNDMVESGFYCTYSDSEGRRESEWGNDTYDTLHAWKVITAALMASFDFAYE